MLDMKALEKALATVGNVGKGEITFDVADTSVTMRVLVPDEDIDAQKYARALAAVEEETGDKGASQLVLLEHYKRATLSHSIVQIGTLDLRDVTQVATGETNANGQAVWVPKHVAVRKILDTWGRLATMLLFAKYAELMQRVDAEADKSVNFVPADLEAEIARVEKRLTLLRSEKERLAQTNTKNPSSDFVRAVASVERTVEGQLRNNVQRTAEVLEPESTPDTAIVPPAPKPQSTAPRQRVAPPVAPPPEREREPVREPLQADRSFDDIPDSMGDGDDAIAAENARLVAARQRARQQSMDAVRQQEQPTRVARRPSNQDAAVLDVGGGSLEAARPAGKIGEHDLYKMPPVTLTDRGREPARKGPIEIDKVESGNPTNPRFQKAPR